MSDQKLKKVGPRERTAISLSTSTNRRARANYERELARKSGPVACAWCGQEPCGVLWTRPGDPDPGGERCCDQCTHQPVDGWLHTHTAWGGGQAFPVCALVMREGETVYLRRDGTVQFLETRAPVPGAALGAEPEADVPAVALLGTGMRGLSLYLAGEGGDRSIDLWQNQQELDPLWIPVRMQGAVARDDARKERRRQEREAADRAHDEKVARIIAEDQAKRDASIAQRQLKHEVRLVLDETLDETEADVVIDDSDASEEAAVMPEASEAVPAVAREPERPVNLKAPAPVKKGPGRPKRSARQRDARKRQKLAWARQEAKNRLEVKRLERLGRTTGKTLVEEKE